MSIVSSYISSRAPVFRINVQASTFMDHILAIVAGLGVRIVIDLVGYENHRLTGSLVGLWEGVVVQHFIKKSPHSFDPFIAYGVRVFIDFLFMESLTRLVLTFLFTGMGIILADIAPRIWADTGLRRLWRHLRRDLYILAHSAPSVPYFDRPRTVRFSPSQAPSITTSLPPSPSIATVTTQPRIPVPRKRPVPGSFPDNVSETDTDLSVRSPGSDYSNLTGLTRDRRPTVQTESEPYDPDEGNRSSSVSETSTPILSEADLPNLPNIEDEDIAREVVLENHKDEDTPRPLPINLPPTPSDTTYPVRLNADGPREVLPPSASLPHIPDDDADWENISWRETQAKPLFQDESTSPLHLEQQVSLSGDQPAASTSLAAEPQPADVPLGDTQQLETPELDPHAEQPHTLLDDAPTATCNFVSAPPPASSLDNNCTNLLLELDSFGPATTDGDRVPCDGNLDIWTDVIRQGGVEAKGLLNKSGNMDIWGDITNRQGDEDGFIIDASQESGQQASAAMPEVILTPAPTSEETTDGSLSIQPENTTSMMTTVQQESTTSSSDTKPGPERSTPPLEDATSHSSITPPVVTNRESSAEQTGTTSSDILQVDLTDGENATEMPALSTSTPQETTLGEEKTAVTSVENPKSVKASTHIVDPFPEKHAERLDKSLELRMEIIKLENVIPKLQSDLTWSKSPASRESILADIKGKEEKLEGLRAKAKLWCEIASEGKEEPFSELNLSAAQGVQFGNDAQTAITLCLLANKMKLTIVLGPEKAKARKTALTNKLDQLNLRNRTYLVGQNKLVIDLPVSKS
ncbi:hypothetical protein C0992_003601 [Termitomyces sp. T32_za158]|nr:hypothetical protein C0992_003601 [Termitomyces sp. T32_za158]